MFNIFKEKRHNARLMRSNGISMTKIAKELKVSLSSIYGWTKDIILTKEQKDALVYRGGPQPKGGPKAISNKAKDKRFFWQQEGIGSSPELGSDLKMLHLAGAMIYWGEGSKNRNSCCISNTDPYLIRTFIMFLRKCFKIQNEKIDLIINLHDETIKEEAQKFWSIFLDLPLSNLKTFIIRDIRSIKSKKKKRHKFGICRLNVNDTKLIQQIFGAIQGYGGFERKEWLTL